MGNCNNELKLPLAVHAEEAVSIFPTPDFTELKNDHPISSQACFGRQIFLPFLFIKNHFTRPWNCEFATHGNLTKDLDRPEENGLLEISGARVSFIVLQKPLSKEMSRL